MPSPKQEKSSLRGVRIPNPQPGLDRKKQNPFLCLYASVNIIDNYQT